jgi:protein ImuB
MLWLCISFPRLPFAALSLDDATLSVITVTAGRRRRILLPSKAAEKINLCAGMDYATAATLCADLKATERNPRAERKALDRLAAWAYQWSSFVTLRQANPKSLTEHSTLWLEIAASFKLFGGCQALLQRIEAELQKLDLDYRLGVAASLEGAALLARANKRIVADTPKILRRHIEPLPLSLLALDETIIFELQRAGIRDIRTLLELPRAALARRFGPQANNYLDRLLGVAADPRPLFQLPKKYRAQCELGAEVTSTEALLFPLRRMLGELQGYLRAIDSGVQQFTIHLLQRDGSTPIAIGFSSAERRAEQFFAIVRERFERLALPAPVLEIKIQADRFTQPAVKQAAIFADDQHTEQFDHVLDKLRARLGESAVHYCRSIADHRPEKAWSHSDAPVTFSHAVAASRPLWLLPNPRPLSAPTKALANGERIEGGWWDGDDTARDYCVLSAANGARYWIYRDLKSDEWFVHGIWG